MIELSREICDTFIAVFVVLAHLRLENRKCSSSQKGARYISTQSDKMVAEDHDLTYASTKRRAVGAEGPEGHAPPWARATNNVKTPQSQMCESCGKLD